MSTEVEQQQPVQAAPADPEPAQAETAEEKKEEKKEVVPIDPKEDFVGWVGQQIPNAIHKFNFYILQWAINLAYAEDDAKKPKLPPNEEVTKSQFLNYLKDGSLLAHLANKLAPQSVEAVKEGEEAKEKEAQKANIEGFLGFAKDKAGLSEQQLFSVEDLQEKGKAGFDQVLNTIFHVAHVAQAKFQQQGIDLDAVITEIAGIAPKSIIEKIRAFVFSKLRRQPSVADKEAGKPGDEPAKDDAKAEPAKPEGNGDAPAEEKKEEAPAVTA